MSTPQVRHLPEYPLRIMSTHLIDWHSIQRGTIPLSPPSLPTRSAIFSNFGSPAPTECPRGRASPHASLVDEARKNKQTCPRWQAGSFKQGRRHNLNDNLLDWLRGGRGKGVSLVCVCLTVCAGGPFEVQRTASSTRLLPCLLTCASLLLHTCYAHAARFATLTEKQLRNEGHSSPPALVFLPWPSHQASKFVPWVCPYELKPALCESASRPPKVLYHDTSTRKKTRTRR